MWASQRHWSDLLSCCLPATPLEIKGRIVSLTRHLISASSDPQEDPSFLRNQSGNGKKIGHGKFTWFCNRSLVNLDVYPSRFTNLFPWSAVGIISTGYGVRRRVHIRPALACTIPGHVPWNKREKDELKRNVRLAVKQMSAFCWFKCWSAFLVTLTVKFSYFVAKCSFTQNT